MTMNCSEVLAELPLFVGGDLEAPGRDQVARHLEDCGSCIEALSAAAEARAVLVEHLERTASAPSDSVWPALREELRAEGLVRTGTSRPTRRAGGRLLRLVPAEGPAPSEPLVRDGSLTPVEAPGSGGESALAERSGGLREVGPSDSLGSRAGLFVEEPVLPQTPFQASHMRMASYGQGASQQAPVLDRAQLLRSRGIR